MIPADSELRDQGPYADGMEPRPSLVTEDRQLLWGHAAEDLRERILTGCLPTGRRLNEVQLARDLGLSRGPLREALRQLEEEGLVVSLPNHGSFVAKVTFEDAAEALQIRKLLEADAVMKAFARNPPALVGLMSRAYEEMCDAGVRSDASAYVLAHSQFHGGAYQLSGSRLLNTIWVRVEAPMRFLLRLRPAPRTLTEAAEGHWPLVALLAEGDGDGALEEVARQLRREEEWLLAGPVPQLKTQF